MDKVNKFLHKHLGHAKYGDAARDQEAAAGHLHDRHAERDHVPRVGPDGAHGTGMPTQGESIEPPSTVGSSKTRSEVKEPLWKTGAPVSGNIEALDPPSIPHGGKTRKEVKQELREHGSDGIRQIEVPRLPNT